MDRFEEAKEFSERMLERARKRQELLSTVITHPILRPLDIPERPSSEISELSSPSPLSELSPASQLSPSPEPFEPILPSAPSPISEPKVQSVSSAQTEVSVPLVLTESSVKESSTPLVPSAPTVASLQQVSSECPANTVEMPTALNHNRRQRLTELANRVGMWLSDDENNLYSHSKKMKKENNPTHNVKLEAPLENTTKKEATKLISLSSSSTTVKEKNDVTKTKSNISTNKEAIKSTDVPFSDIQLHALRVMKVIRERSAAKKSGLYPDSEDDYQDWVYGTPSVAERRAMFEKCTTQPQSTKSITSTSVASKASAATDTANAAVINCATTIANKYAVATVNVNNTTVTSTATIVNNKNRIDTISTSSCSTTCSTTSTPLSRYACNNSEPKSFGSTSPMNHDTWKPPCIKNVLLKKQLEDFDNEPQKNCGETAYGILATSSPHKTSLEESPAEKIAKKAGHVRFRSPLPTDGLYPLVEVDHDTDLTVATALENHLPSSKRRNDGSSAMNTSIRSYESLSEDCNIDENIVAKRSRCEPKTEETEMIINKLEDNSIEGTPGTTSSLLSEHDGSFSQTSDSFTFYQPPKIEPCRDFEESQVTKEVIESNEIPKPSTSTQPPLVHTISTYRKQQRLRLANNKMKNTEKNSKEPQRTTSFIDDEEEVCALEIIAERIRALDSTVNEQNRIIDQATQALNISEMYRQKNSQSSRSSEYSTEHLHAERLLLIANLKRRDAVIEAQRLRHEPILSPTGAFHFRTPGKGKRLVIESLRVPLLTAITSGNNSKNKADHVTGSLTKWPQEIRYFVCVVRATATVYRPPMTTATRPVDAINESVYRFTLDNHTPYNELGYGYVEFISRKNISSSDGRRKCPDAEGAPIVINGLDNGGWKITVELYGLYPTATKEPNHGNSSGNSKDHHEKSVLDKLWSSVTPNKESKRQHFIKVPSIESPGGSSAVRSTMFRQLGYFVFSNSEVDRRQFTLTKVHQSSSSTSTSNAVSTDEPEVVRVCMQIIEEGEEYVSKHDTEDLKSSISSSSHKYSLVIKPLTFPPACRRIEGFITLFDDFALRPAFEFEPNETPKWQHFINKKSNVDSRALWTRLWCRLVIINDPNVLKDDGEDNDNGKKKEIIHPQTIVLYYWLYPEHAEQQREPLGIIDLSGCLPLKEGVGLSKPLKVEILPPAQRFSDTSCRPHTVRLLFTGGYKVKEPNTYPNNLGVNEPLLLAFDTSFELTEWCNTINEAVHAIAAHREQFNKIYKFR